MQTLEQLQMPSILLSLVLLSSMQTHADEPQHVVVKQYQFDVDVHWKKNYIEILQNVDAIKVGCRILCQRKSISG